tara:strand:+ start:175 stop:876 length:702 start_codon:yes stop_codon:yes gene_type:complete
MKKIILSPPFSNIYRNENCTNIVGTYTANKRKGLHRVFTTLKPTKNGWYNKVGLRNPGIKNIKCKESDIVSIHLFSKEDWYKIYEVLSSIDINGIEINISCPNVNKTFLNQEILDQALKTFKNVFVKISNGYEYRDAIKLYESGINRFHISNTMKTSSGGLSGISLVYNNISLIKSLKRDLKSDIRVIGGGGIYDLNIARLYKEAGADYLSLSTVLLNPIKSKKLIKEIHEEF